MILDAFMVILHALCVFGISAISSALVVEVMVESSACVHSPSPLWIADGIVFSDPVTSSALTLAVEIGK